MSGSRGSRLMMRRRDGPSPNGPLAGGVRYERNESKRAAQRSIAPVLKTAEGASSPWVRIPPPPHFAGVLGRFAVEGEPVVALVQPTYSQRDGMTRDEPGERRERAAVALPSASVPEERSLGGNLNDAVRVGDTVRRRAGPWTPAVHALLRYLESAGFEAPRVVGMDAQGREVLGFSKAKRTRARSHRCPTQSSRTLTSSKRRSCCAAITTSSADSSRRWTLAGEWSLQPAPKSFATTIGRRGMRYCATAASR